MKLNTFFIRLCHLTTAVCAGVVAGGEQSNSRLAAKVRADVADSIQIDETERTWRFIVIHHSATDSGSVESIHRDHRSRRDRSGRPWLGIGYHFVIGNGSGMADGQISPTFRWKQQLHGAHSGSLPHNSQGIGICLIGNFENSKPTPAQHAAVTELIRQIVRHYNIEMGNIIGHSNVRATACPGRYFPLRDVIQDSTRSVTVTDPIYSFTVHSGQLSRY